MIVVDGESQDQTRDLAADHVDQLLISTPGRAKQMNYGAQHANGEILWFLHADSQPPANADQLIQRALAEQHMVWGRFNVRLSGKQWMFRVIATLMNWRSAITGIATGDQGIFIRRSWFEQIGAYPNIALMEDIALSQKLRKHHRPICLRAKISTSSRRWEQHGTISTILTMWRLRWAYFMGADPDKLAELYNP